MRVLTSEAKEIILKTKTGRDILDNCQTALYEQQTENLAGIATELQSFQQYENIVGQLSDANIADAMKQLNRLEKTGWNSFSVRTCEDNDLKEQRELKAELTEKQKYMWKVKNQNKINVERIKNADKFKRQK